MIQHPHAAVRTTHHADIHMPSACRCPHMPILQQAISPHAYPVHMEPMPPPALPRMGILCSFYSCRCNMQLPYSMQVSCGMWVSSIIQVPACGFGQGLFRCLSYDNLAGRWLCCVVLPGLTWPVPSASSRTRKRPPPRWTSPSTPPVPMHAAGVVSDACFPG